VIHQKFFSNLASIKSSLDKNAGIGLMQHLSQKFCKNVLHKKLEKETFSNRRNILGVKEFFLTPTNLGQDQISVIW